MKYGDEISMTYERHVNTRGRRYRDELLGCFVGKGWDSRKIFKVRDQLPVYRH
jgi:hypothetical protein